MNDGNDVSLLKREYSELDVLHNHARKLKLRSLSDDFHRA